MMIGYFSVRNELRMGGTDHHALKRAKFRDFVNVT